MLATRRTPCGWAQVLVYIGAVAILIVFAILLTRSSETRPATAHRPSLIVGCRPSRCLFFWRALNAIMNSSIANREPPVKPEPTVRQIGTQLMTATSSASKSIGLLLTAATIGAVIIALHEPGGKKTACRNSGNRPHKEGDKVESREDLTPQP